MIHFQFRYIDASEIYSFFQLGAFKNLIQMAPLCISSKFTVAAYTESVLYDKTYVLKNDETFSEQDNIESAFLQIKQPTLLNPSN